MPRTSFRCAALSLLCFPLVACSQTSQGEAFDIQPGARADVQAVVERAPGVRPGSQITQIGTAIVPNGTIIVCGEIDQKAFIGQVAGRDQATAFVLDQIEGPLSTRRQIADRCLTVGVSINL